MATVKTATTAQLFAEIQRRERSAGKIQARRDKLAKELAKLDAELSALGAVASAPALSTGPRRGAPKATTAKGKRGGRKPGKRTRAKNEMNLPDALAASMEIGAVVSPQEAATLVSANGYKSTAANFNMLVSNALTKDKRFKRISRGQYERTK